MLALLVLATIIALLPWLLLPAAPTYLPAADQRQLDEWADGLTYRLDSARGNRPNYTRRYPTYPRYKTGSRFAAVPQVKLAPFDPNALTAEGWEARGVPHFVAGRIFNYGQKAGGFKSKSQLRRVYGLTDSVYQRLAPFVQLPDEAPGRERGGATYAAAGSASAAPGAFPRKPTHLQPFDLNLADTTQLMQIRGIGRGRANSVVKLRQRLGGFIAEGQLVEVYSLRDAPDLVDSLRKYTFVAADYAPQLLHINTGTFDDLWGHPYVGKPLARLIVAFRAQHGPYQTPDDLHQLKLLTPEQFEKLRPYVRCD